MKRAKIICTLGPSTDSPEMIRKLIEAGMNVARFNFSHGDHADHLRRLEVLRRTSEALGAHVAALGDLQGPKIRVARFREGFVHLTRGQRFTITTRPVPGTVESVSTTHSGLPRDVRADDSILLADGLLELKVLSVTQTDVECEVVIGGPLSNNKGINLPSAEVSAPSLTGKDREDLRFAVSAGFDYLALSFVRKAEDIEDCRALVAAAGGQLPIVAKVEKPQAVLNLDGILAAADAVMVARGDLGVEMPPESVPATQKQIIRQCMREGVPVITATQMLESMIDNPRPTRAEASDVANAIFDGTDAVMLSGETANGKYPDLVCAMMTRIAKVSEIQDFTPLRPLPEGPETTRAAAVTRACVTVADRLGAELIVTYSCSGETARQIARNRPRTRILALTPTLAGARRLALVWGVETVVAEPMTSVDELFAQVNREVLAHKLARPGDTVVIVAGTPPGESSAVNMMKIHDLV